MRTIAFAACIAGLTAGTAQAATFADPYSGLFVFGDSLSDPGNLFGATSGTTPPSPPYFEGRFSNGPVWAERVDDAFAVSANFAFGGAQAATDADGIPDLDAQVDLALASGVPFGARPLAAVWLGANDLFAGIASGNPASAIAGAATALSTGIGRLRNAGVADFVLFNLPDLGQTPLYETVLGTVSPGIPAGATAATDAFNAQVADLARGLRAGGAGVTLIDVNGFFDMVLDAPADYGLTETDLPCLFRTDTAALAPLVEGVRLATGQAAECADPDERAFFDLVHPSATLHAAVADLVESDLAPVPLPATLPLLAATFGAFGLARRRARVAG